VAQENCTVLQVHTGFAAGGSERQVVLLASGLARRGIEPIIACPAGAWLAAIEAGIKVWPLVSGKPEFANVLRLISSMRSHRVRIVQSHTAVADLLSAAAAMLARVPIRISTRHALRCECLYAGRARRYLIRHISHRITRHAFTAVTAVSEAAARANAAHGCPRQKSIVVVRNGVEIPCGAKQDSLSPMGIPENSWIVACLGRLSPEKGQRFLLQAAALVRKTIPELRVIFAGNGPDRDSLAQIASDLGIRESILFPGWIADVAPLLRNADVVVQPSLFEGFGLSIAEAMAAACPVICTSVGGLTELVLDEVTGLLVPPANAEALAAALMQIFREPARAVQLGAAARKRIEQHFSAARMIEDTCNLYKQLLRDAGSA
jgi:glycosyltransferase involved in cell wall biosynthesis